MTSPDEIVNAIAFGVTIIGAVLIVTLVFMFADRYRLYKFNKYVKKAKEREEAETAKDKAGRFHAGRGKW